MSNMRVKMMSRKQSVNMSANPNKWANVASLQAQGNLVPQVKKKSIVPMRRMTSRTMVEKVVEKTFGG